MKGLRLIVISLFVILFTGCADRLKDIDITSFRPVSLTPQGLDSIAAHIELGIDNPSIAFELADIKATVRFKGEDALYLYADRLIVDARCQKLYNLLLNGKCAEDFNPFKLLQLVGDKADVSDVTISVEAFVCMRGGLGKNIEYNEITLDQLLKRI